MNNFAGLLLFTWLGYDKAVCSAVLYAPEILKFLIIVRAWNKYWILGILLLPVFGRFKRFCS